MSRATAFRTVLLAAALLLAWKLFWQLTTLLLALLLTVIIALPLTAATDWLAARRVPRAVGAIGTLLLALSGLALLISQVVPPLREQFDMLVEQLPQIVESLRASVAGIVGAERGEAGRELQIWVQSLLSEPQQLLGRLRDVLTTAVAIVGGAILIVLTALYIAISPQPLVDGMLRLLPPARRQRAHAVFCRLRHLWLSWLAATALDMVLVGVLTYFALMLLGLEFALVFAVVAALFEFVPYIGPIVAGAITVLYALTQSVELAIVTLVVFLAIQQVESNIIVPLIMSRAVELHPAVVAFGVVIIGQVFGLMGLFVAVPLLLAVTVLTQELWVQPVEEEPSAVIVPDGGDAGVSPPRPRTAPSGR